MHARMETSTKRDWDICAWFATPEQCTLHNRCRDDSSPWPMLVNLKYIIKMHFIIHKWMYIVVQCTQYCRESDRMDGSQFLRDEWMDDVWLSCLLVLAFYAEHAVISGLDSRTRECDAQTQTYLRLWSQQQWWAMASLVGAIDRHRVAKSTARHNKCDVANHRHRSEVGYLDFPIIYFFPTATDESEQTKCNFECVFAATGSISSTYVSQLRTPMPPHNGLRVCFAFFSLL